MLPLGTVSGGATNATGRSTYFTTNEQYTLMSLWAIARSPLILGADMTQIDAFTLSLLTNDEVIAVNQYSLHNRQLFRTNDLIAWTADAEGSTNKYLALFNATASPAAISVNLASLGYTNACAIRSLWDQRTWVPSPARSRRPFLHIAACSTGFPVPRSPCHGSPTPPPATSA